jgi:hypothetical protein
MDILLLETLRIEFWGLRAVSAVWFAETALP